MPSFLNPPSTLPSTLNSPVELLFITALHSLLHANTLADLASTYAATVGESNLNHLLGAKTIPPIVLGQFH